MTAISLGMRLRERSRGLRKLGIEWEQRKCGARRELHLWRAAAIAPDRAREEAGENPFLFQD